MEGVVMVDTTTAGAGNELGIVLRLSTILGIVVGPVWVLVLIGILGAEKGMKEGARAGVLGKGWHGNVLESCTREVRTSFAKKRMESSVWGWAARKGMERWVGVGWSSP